MIRESSWEIIWSVAGADPVTLLTYGDAMDAEIRLSGQQLAGTGRSDFARSAVPISRGNAKRRLEFSRRTPHATAALAWQAAMATVKLAPWGLKGMLSIQPAGGTARLYQAALLSVAARPDSLDGLTEHVESWAWRLLPLPVAGPPPGSILVSGDLTDGTNPIIFPPLLPVDNYGDPHAEYTQSGDFNTPADGYFSLVYWDGAAYYLTRWLFVGGATTQAHSWVGDGYATTQPLSPLLVTEWTPDFFSNVTGTPVLTLV